MVEGRWTHGLDNPCHMPTLSAALAAAQMWPSLELAQQSIRTSASHEFAGGGLPLRDTAQAFLPRVLSRFSPLYVGLTGLGLALLASEYRTLERTWTETPTGQIAAGFHIGVGLGNRHLDARFVDCQESEHLVRRPLHVKLNLGVLVGHPHRLDRGLAHVDRLAVNRFGLAQALGPKLSEPIGNVAQLM